MSEKSFLSLAALATAAVEELNVKQLSAPQWKDEDFTCTGLIDTKNCHWVAIQPHSVQGKDSLQAEVSFLNSLANYKDAHRIFFEIPRPAGFLSLPTEQRILLYKQLPGSPLKLYDLDSNAPLSAQVGKAIANLHEVPANLTELAGFPSLSAQSIRTKWLDRLDEAAASRHVPGSLLQRWEEALEEVAWWRFKPTTVHSDLSASKLRVSNDRVLSIEGFSKVKVADPAQDLAWIVAQADYETVERVLVAYHIGRTEGADPYLLTRAELYGELALLSWLLYGLRSDSEEVIEDACGLLDELYENVGDTSLKNADHFPTAEIRVPEE